MQGNHESFYHNSGSESCSPGHASGGDPLQLEHLRHPFNNLFRQELLLFHELTRRLLGHAVSELDTIIPAVVFLDTDQVRLRQSR